MAKSPGRRRVVAGLSAALALRHIPAGGVESFSRHRSALRSAFLETCGGTKLSSELAHACIRQCPDSILSRTTADLAASFERAQAGGASFREWFQQQTMADFSEERVVRVQGWVISETEFLLFARLGAAA
jgi:hypothetical protein